jgi:hypothetical protein
MPIRVDAFVAECNGPIVQNGTGTMYTVQTPGDVLYMVYGDRNQDISFAKSTDGGITWSPATVVFAGTATALAVWYDKWSGLAGGLIHVAYQESVTDDTLYRTIDTASSDALSTQTVVLAGTSTLAGGALSITRSRGGNVYCATMIDAGTEGGFLRLPNANVPNGAWDAALTTVFEAATSDQIILVPGFAADDQDIMAMFWDSSADEISRKIYDNSANSWAETSIATSMVDYTTNNAFPNFSIAVDLTNSRIILAAWSAVDLVNADLRCWTITESAITAVTDVITNSTDDQALCALTIDQLGRWWCFYAGKTNGTQTWTVSVRIYCKVSTDAGTTWGPETEMSNLSLDIRSLWGAPINYIGDPVCCWFENNTLDYVRCNSEVHLAAPTLAIGL